MCTPLMAQRCLLHHTALATGFCLFPALSRSTTGLPASSLGKNGDELIALGIAKIIAETCSMCYSVCTCTCPYISEGAHLVLAAEQDRTVCVCKTTLVTVSLE